MSEMVERVARAVQICRAGFGTDEDIARSAIAAMEDITPEMGHEFYRAGFIWPSKFSKNTCKTSGKLCVLEYAPQGARAAMSIFVREALK